MRYDLRPPLVLSVVLLSSAACSDDTTSAIIPPTSNAGTSALDRLLELGLDDFHDLCAASNLAALLDGDTEVTLFAPTDAALEALGGWPIGQAGFTGLGVAAQLTPNHVVSGVRLDAGVLAALGTLQTEGGSLLVDVDPVTGELMLDGARVALVDDASDHATIHVIDRVLHPPLDPIETLLQRGHTTFVAALAANGLTEEARGGSFTILAPTEAAFSALDPADLTALLDPAAAPTNSVRLRRHLVNGTLRASELAEHGWYATAEGSLVAFSGAGDGTPTVNGRRLQPTNAVTDRGIVQALEGVLEPPRTFDDVLVAENLLAFEGLLFAAGLASEFEDRTTLTAFVPTDAAFAALPAGVLDDLVDPANIEMLRSTLRGHGVVEARGAAALAPGDLLTTLAGTDLSITDDGAGGLLLGGSARLVSTDHFIENGVVHVIDAVLAP